MSEPYGHSHPYSKIERYWAQRQTPGSLHRRRITAYDAHSAMTYSPMEYITTTLVLREDNPADDWICKAFMSFVKTEFASRNLTQQPTRWRPEIASVMDVPDRFLDEFLAGSESVGNIDLAPRDDTSPAAMATRLFDLLCHRAVGAPINRSNNDCVEFTQRIGPAIEDKARLLFVLPGFPFKDQNRFRVPFSGDTPDMAEIAFLIRLHRLTQAIYQVHPFGADVVVLTDGHLYGDIFGIPEQTVSTYEARLRSYRNRLNLQGTVSFLSLKDIIKGSADGSGVSRAWACVAHIRTRLMALVAANLEMKKTCDMLVTGMKWNSESRQTLQGYTDEVSWSILRNARDSVPEECRTVWDEVHASALRAASEYASINLMLRWLDLISLCFPGSIRGTVHPKTGQFALAGSGGAYAWNGVAWAKSWPRNIDDIDVRPFVALSDIPRIIEVRFESTKWPAFYTQG